MTIKKQMFKSAWLEASIQILGIGITSYLVDFLGYMYLITAVFISGAFFIIRFYISKYWIFES